MVVVHDVFPVIVRANDCGDLMVFRCDKELQRLEKIDVEAGEYQCWNARGEACALSGDSKGRVGVRITDQANPWTLKEALEDFARRNGIDPDPLLTANTDPVRVIGQLRAIIEGRKTPSIVTRIRRLLFK
jgi:hypothetical protein